MHSSLRSAALMLASLLILVGCGQGGGKGGESLTGGEKTARDSTVEYCNRMLPHEAAEQLAGQSLDRPIRARIGPYKGCRWLSGDSAATNVQAARLPADEWAAGLGDLLEQVEASGQFDDPQNRKKISQARRLIRSGEFTSAQACGLFRDMTVMQGIEGGGDWIVNFVPNRETPQAVNAQRCFEGTYTSVQLQKPDLKATDTEMSRVKEALDAVR